MWTTGEKWEGVVLKKSRGEYTCAPVDLVTEIGGLFDAVEMLNVKVSIERKFAIDSHYLFRLL